MDVAIVHPDGRAAKRPVKPVGPTTDTIRIQGRSGRTTLQRLVRRLFYFAAIEAEC